MNKDPALKKERSLPTIKRYMDEVPSPTTMSKLKYWESTKHQGRIPKDSVVADINRRFCQDKGPDAEQPASRKSKKNFQRKLEIEELELEVARTVL
ncbi:hypothetical protein P9112_000862 [Eukaryota sp. TZLM1-RC]